MLQHLGRIGWTLARNHHLARLWRRVFFWDTRPGKHTKNYGKSPGLMGNSTIFMVIFNSYVKLPEGTIGGNSKNIEKHANLKNMVGTSCYFTSWNVHNLNPPTIVVMKFGHIDNSKHIPSGKLT